MYDVRMEIFSYRYPRSDLHTSYECFSHFAASVYHTSRAGPKYRFAGGFNSSPKCAGVPRAGARDSRAFRRAKGGFESRMSGYYSVFKKVTTFFLLFFLRF